MSTELWFVGRALLCVRSREDQKSYWLLANICQPAPGAWDSQAALPGVGCSTNQRKIYKTLNMADPCLNRTEAMMEAQHAAPRAGGRAAGFSFTWLQANESHSDRIPTVGRS